MLEEQRGFIELQSGLHRRAPDGTWVECDPAIEVSPDRQSGLVQNLQYQAIIAANLATPNCLDLLLPPSADGGGQRLTGHLLGLAYFDRNGSALIAEPKEVNGEIIGPGRNEIVFRDAMTELSMDIHYVIERGRFAQNVILRQRIPSPIEYGLTENAVLAVLTEFTEAPLVERITRNAGQAGQAEAEGDAAMAMADEHLRIGVMEFAPGKALALGGDGPVSVQSIRHSWEQFEGGRHCLVEQIPWKELEPGLRDLPAAQANAGQRWKERNGQQARALGRKSVLPLRRMAKTGTSRSTGELVLNTRSPSVLSGRGYLLDFELVTTSTNVVFAGDKTFYVSGPFNIAGTNRLESCVIKFAPTNGAKLNITGTLICDTAPSRVALLTARDDDDAGEVIGTNSLSGYYATTALAFANGGSSLRHVRISHASTGVSYDNTTGDDHTNTHVQFVNCLRAISGGNGRAVRVRNVLMSGVKTNFDTAGSFTARCEHLTAGSFDSLTNGTVTLHLTNSILVGNSAFVYPTDQCQDVAAYTSSTGVFQQVGAGAWYLAPTAGALRNAGTTNIDASLRADLTSRTTDPPVVLAANYLVATDADWYPTVQRDTGPPDLGWHYDPVDYAINLAYVEPGKRLTIHPGTVVAAYGSSGLRPKSGSTVLLNGRVGQPVTFASFINVQEQPGVWANPEILLAAAWYTTGATVTVRFAEFQVIGGTHYSVYCNHTGEDKNFDVFNVANSQFFNGRNKFGSTNGAVHTFGNNLFFRGDVHFRDKAALTVYNNTFYKGKVSFSQVGTATWTITDNLFDQFTYSYQSIPYLTHGWNGYANCGSSRIGPSANNDQVITGAFAYDTGPLGAFYLGSTGAALVNAGSRTADLAELFNHVTGADQVRETNSVVDIGWHYVATSGLSSTAAMDSDGDGLADYLEDTDLDGVKDSAESSFSLTDTDGDGVSDYVEFLQGRNPNAGSVNDTNGIVSLRVYTPLR